MTPFNKPHLTGKETHYIYEAVNSGKLSGNGIFTQRCHAFFEQRYRFGKCLLTTSCTDALEMAAILCDVKPGDEVIVPSYTFVSTALAFVRQGATIVFADSMENHPNIDASKLEALITPRTRVIVPVHYAGMACDMDAIMALAARHNLLVVEDAAQAIDSYFTVTKTGSLLGAPGTRLPLGSIGHMAAFSFHETKNIISGEGGMLAVNDRRFVHRAEIIWEKGTNRAEFFRGEVNKYGWVDTGSSFLPSEVIAAFLWAQLENLDDIQNRRKHLWSIYHRGLQPLASTGAIALPHAMDYATNNAHMFYIVCRNLDERTRLIAKLKEQGIHAVFHYLSLHDSEFYRPKHDGRHLPHTDHFADTLLRLPMYFDLPDQEVERIVETINQVYALG